MDRRRFLATTAAGAVAAAAGCVGTGFGPTRIGGPTEWLDDDGREKHLQFDIDDERLAVLTLDQMTRPATPTDPFRLRLHVAHRSDDERLDRPTTIERFRFDLRAPPASVGPPAEIYLNAPGGPSFPDLVFRRTADSWTRIEATDTGAIGDGTLTLETIVQPIGEFPAEIGLRAEVQLSTGGMLRPTYVLEALSRFAPVGPGEPNSTSE